MYVYVDIELDLDLRDIFINIISGSFLLALSLCCCALSAAAAAAVVCMGTVGLMRLKSSFRARQTRRRDANKKTAQPHATNV